MKRKPLVSIIFCILVIGCILALRLIPRTLSAEQCSEVYQRYANHDGIRASFIKDKRIVGTVSVDVTLLEAFNDSAWASLQEDFNIASPPQEVMDFAGERFIAIWEAPKKDYALPKDTLSLNNDLIAASWSERKICIFSIETLQQLRAIQKNQLKESINLSKTISVPLKSGRV